METILREYARYPAQVAVPTRPHVKLGSTTRRRMAAERKSKELRDKLEEGVKKHEEKAQLLAGRMSHNAEMGMVEARERAFVEGRSSHFSNQDMVRKALSAPASLAGINTIRGVHAVHFGVPAGWTAWQQDQQKLVKGIEPDPKSAAKGAAKKETYIGTDTEGDVDTEHAPLSEDEGRRSRPKNRPSRSRPRATPSQSRPRASGSKGPDAGSGDPKMETKRVKKKEKD